MKTGQDFLKSQVNNAVMLHKEFLESLKSHASEADDRRFAELCNRFIPIMTQHQGELEQYQRRLGGQGEGTVKRIIGRVAEAGKDLVDSARQDDFLRLVQDIVMARQAEDTFKTFREAGRTLGIDELERLGDKAERDHDAYVEEANQLAQTFFVEHVRAGQPASARV